MCPAEPAEHREHGDAVAELRGVEVGMIGPDDPRFFEGADPAQAGRGGHPDHLRQFDIGDPAVFLDFAENLQVDLIEFLARHFVTSAFQARSEEHTSALQSLMRISYAVY